MYGNDTGHIWIFADETGFKHVVLRLFAMTVQIDCSIFFFGDGLKRPTRQRFGFRCGGCVET